MILELAVGILFYLIYRLILYTKIRIMTRNIPSAKGRSPIIGHAHLFLNLTYEDALPMFDKLKSEVPGPVMLLDLGYVINIFLYDHKDIQELLNSTVHLNKSFAYDLTKKWLGNGMLTVSGSLWHPRRKLLNRSFHVKLLESFTEVFSRQANVLVNRLIVDIAASSSPTVDFEYYIASCSLDIAGETIMSAKLDAQLQESKFERAVKDVCGCIMERSMKIWHFVDFIYNLTEQGRFYNKQLTYVKDYVSKIIIRKKQELTKTTENGVLTSDEKMRKALVDLLLEMQNESKIKNKEIEDEVNTFLFAGHDTTASCIGFTLFELSKHPEIQENIYKEIISVVGDKKNKLSYQDLVNMKYLDLVVKEGLRLYSPVPLIGRHLYQDFTLPSGYKIPAGCSIMLNLFSLHRNPEVFDRPLEFDPDRFLPENSAGRHPYTFIPFSNGPRNCIGQKFAMLEAKAVIASVVREFHIGRCQDFEPRLAAAIVLRSLNGLRINLTRRQAAN